MKEIEKRERKRIAEMQEMVVRSATEVSNRRFNGGDDEGGGVGGRTMARLIQKEMKMVER